MQAVVVAFLGIGGGAVLILVWGPTVTPYRLLGFLGCEFVLTGNGRGGGDPVGAQQAVKG